MKSVWDVTEKIFFSIFFFFSTVSTSKGFVRGWIINYRQGEKHPGIKLGSSHWHGDPLPNEPNPDDHQ